MDTEACPIATSTMDASGVPPSLRPTADMATYMDGGSVHASFAYDIEDTISHAVPATATPDVPSFTCSPVDMDIGYASPIDVVAAPTPLTHSISAAIAGS